MVLTVRGNLNIVSSLRSATCSLNVIPITLLKEVLDSIAPNIISVISSSFQTSSVPSCFKHAVVNPLLKKANMDPSDLNNYRPISKSFGESCFKSVIPLLN